MPLSLQKEKHIGTIINCIRSINSCIQRQSKELTKTCRISGPQLGALRIASRSPRISLKELSDKLYLHVSTVSGIISRLEARGYVTRTRDNEDRRVVNIELTNKGAKLIAGAPFSSFGNMIEELQKMPVSRVRDISRSMEILSGLMKVDGTG
jgi:DNA-binding MarR family transcriptional regulator